MKKLVIRLAIVFVVLVLLAVLAVRLFLDSAIKRGVETVGPMVAKVPIKLDSVKLSLLSGSGKVNGLVVGNPEPYKAPSAIQVGMASLAIQPGSIFSDKVIIKSVHVQAPEITFETDLKGNNLSKIMANVQATTGGKDTGGKDSPPSQSPAPEAKAGKKLQVDEFVITGGKIHVSITALGSKSATVPLPDIHLTDLGKGPEGITAAELTQVVLAAIEKQAVQAASGAVTDLSKGLSDLGKQAVGESAGAVDKATKSVTDLFKKK